MFKLTFVFEVKAKPTYPVPLLSGAVDVNRDEKYDTASESLAFERQNATTWRAQKDIPLPLAGINYLLHYTIGAGIPWELKVLDEAGVLHGGGRDVSADVSDFYPGVLS